MTENLMVGTHKYASKKWSENYDRIFKKSLYKEDIDKFEEDIENIKEKFLSNNFNDTQLHLMKECYEGI